MTEVRVEKLFRHPPERVFDAFLDPARVGDWLFRTPEGVMDLRASGGPDDAPPGYLPWFDVPGRRTAGSHPPRGDRAQREGARSSPPPPGRR